MYFMTLPVLDTLIIGAPVSVPAAPSVRRVKRETGTASAVALKGNLCCPRNGKRVKLHHRPLWSVHGKAMLANSASPDTGR